MRKAITISLLFHVALLTWALGYFASGDKPKPIKKASVPVDIMTPSQFTKIKAGKKDAQKDKKKAGKPKPVAKKIKPKTKKPVTKKKKPEKKKPVKKAKKPAPKKTVKPKPKPKKIAKPKPKPKKGTKPKPVNKKLVKAKPKMSTPPKTTKPKSEFDAENIAALLNKLPNEKPAPKSSYKVPLEPAPRAQKQARVEPPSYGRTYGADATMSANEIDAFKAQISQCWRPPTGGLGSRDLNVKLRIKFKEDGTLEKPPELANYSGSPFFRPAAEAAKRAVWQCQPYRMPQNKFATWQDMILNFDPRDMFGG